MTIPAKFKEYIWLVNTIRKPLAYGSNQRWLGERLIEAAREDKDINKVMQQEAMVKDTLPRAFEELHAGEVYDDARSLFND